MPRHRRAQASQRREAKCPLRQFRPTIEPLERRDCPSVYYDFSENPRAIVAQTGAGQTFSALGGNVSINDNGQVAFIGTAGGQQNLYTGALNGTLTNDSNLTGASFRPMAAIRNDGSIITLNDTATGAELRQWTPLASGGFSTTVIATGSATGNFLALFNSPAVTSSLPASLPVIFPAQNSSNQTVLVQGSSSSPGVFATQMIAGAPTALFPAVADDGSVVVKSGTAAASPLLLFGPGFTAPVTIADSSGGWTRIGNRPGISRDGTIIVFAGNRGSGDGIFASILKPDNTRQIVLLAGENQTANGTRPDLGLDASGRPIGFMTFDVDNEVSVVKQSIVSASDSATPKVGDTFTVSFMGTPTKANLIDPRVSTTANLFTGQDGLFTTMVSIDNNLATNTGPIYHVTSSIPVVQVGDRLNGQTITALSVTEGLANAAVDRNGTARTQRKGDHLIAFWAQTNTGQQYVVRTAHLDTTEDGLLDHWKIWGVDVNQDGNPTLKLSDYGAKVGQRDLFLQIDWTNNRTTGSPQGWNDAPAPGVTQWVANMFAAAPAIVRRGANIPAGIVLHLDAGPGMDADGNPLSQNVPTNLAKGGNMASMPDGSHPDLVYFGTIGSASVSGVNSLPASTIKDAYLDSLASGARELTFHYGVLADFSSYFQQPDTITATSTTPNGDRVGFNIPIAAGDSPGAILITSGPERGQLRLVGSVDPTNRNFVYLASSGWGASGPPAVGTSFVWLSGSSGLGEVYFRPSPDNSGAPGNDFLMSLGGFGVNAGGWLGNAFAQQRTIAHELGHTFGLRHGGTDHTSSKPANTYLSLMSYTHQLELDSTVNSFSSAGDPTFDDWSNINLDFQDFLVNVGNTYSIPPAGLGAVTTNPDLPEEDEFAFFAENGLVDLTPPVAQLVNPAADKFVYSGGTLTVLVHASDNDMVATVTVAFDLNGNGTMGDPGDTVFATQIAPGLWQATFVGVVGPVGQRTLTVTVDDRSFNDVVLHSSVIVSAGDGVDHPAVFSNGMWSLDAGNGRAPVLATFGTVGDRPLAGDWAGDGFTRLGVYRPDGHGALQFVLDTNGNNAYDAGDLSFTFGAEGDQVIVGDWTGDGRAKVGVVRNDGSGQLLFVLDTVGDGVYRPGVDRVFHFGVPGDQVLVGDWNGQGIDLVGVARPDGQGSLNWSLANDQTGTSFRNILHFGAPGDQLVVGDWNHSGATKIGVVRQVGADAVFSLNTNGDGSSFDNSLFGAATDGVLVGDWTGSGSDKIGVARSSGSGFSFTLDADDNGTFDLVDRAFTLVGTGGTVLVGKWEP